MNTKTIWSVLPAFFLPLFIFAQTQTLRGTVYDQQSETPLIGATVQLIASDVSAGAAPQTIGSTTDVNGAFTLKNIPVGRQALRVTYLGYEPQTVSNLLVTAGKEVLLNIHMQESFSTLNEITITANVDKDRPMNELATISARQFNTEEVMRYSGGRNDVAKMVANFANNPSTLVTASTTRRSRCRSFSSANASPTVLT